MAPLCGWSGLLLAAVDTEGRPGMVWRTRHATEHAGAAVRRTRREARLAARAARTAAKVNVAQLVHHAA
jgi:hypothetical protein